MARRARCLVLFTLLLTACGGQMAVSKATPPNQSVPVAAVANHRVVKDIVLDGGALTARPPGSAVARYSLGRAKKVVLAAYSDVANGTTYDPILVALGRVTLSLKHAVGLPSYQDRLAWIAFFQQFTAPPCPSEVAPADGSYSPFFYVVILDAQTGKDALTYQTRGIGDCGGPVRGPYLRRAQELLSVPWTAVGEQPVSSSPPVYLPGGNTTPTITTEWTIRYTVPACARLHVASGGGPGPETFLVDVEVPLDPPPHCSPARSVTTTWPSGNGELAHSPTGLTSGVVENGALVTF